MNPEETAKERADRAQQIAEAGGIERALATGALDEIVDTTVSEALVLGLLRQKVTRFLVVLGHGSTEIGEVLRLYAERGIVRVFGVRNEVEASHAAAALRWVSGEKAAVVTSIGPGALHAFAGSLAAASNGLGVWYLFGDETTEDEGPNMQQVPGPGQGSFLRIVSQMGGAYSLHTPYALGPALLRGMACVEDPGFARPFFLLLPLNMQPARLERFHMSELPQLHQWMIGPAEDQDLYSRAVGAIGAAKQLVVKVGAGARFAGPQIERLLELADGVAVLSPRASGVLPYNDPRNLLVAGSKGTSCGNAVTESADTLVALGTRSVCQSDSSRTAYPNVRTVVNINSDPISALHYARTIPLIGDVQRTLERLNALLAAATPEGTRQDSSWLERCREQKEAWIRFKRKRYENPVLYDEIWKEPVLTQPAAIKRATDWARGVEAVTFFDAGDVQANGFQIAEDDRVGRTFTETGASYMGFAVSALLATGLGESPFYGLAITGDGSFMMNPQILIDGTEHGARGCILLLDNRRMAAISALQREQYGRDFATSDSVRVDYLAMAAAVSGVLALDGGRTLDALAEALDRARAHAGLTLIHVPVYYGDDPLGGLGAFGRWNVGNWVDDVQALRHRIGL